ncbi:MAG TPA: 16S rRNA (guanine(527)-N(7))-methyltransferase RsmG [Anaerolineales bacterium]|jgi:16S rRNA (guanine527-N7)-methyltransferase
MEELVQQAQSLFNIHLTGSQVAAFATYERELLEWNKKFNLTAIRDPQSIRSKHFLDSLSCTLAWADSPPARLVDVGTGAGFPGIPLKILYPEMQLTLVESVGKKARFCEHMVEVLGLASVEVIPARAEDLCRDPAQRESYDCAVARQVANLSVLAEFLLPLVKRDGIMLAQKGASGPAEARSAERAFNLLGGKLEQQIPVHLPGVDGERYLIIVKKMAPTPAKYPRKAGTPAKQPL